MMSNEWESATVDLVSGVVMTFYKMFSVPLASLWTKVKAASS